MNRLESHFVSNAVFVKMYFVRENCKEEKKKKRQIKDHIGYAHLVSRRVWENRYKFPFPLSVLHCFQAGASACCCVVTQIHMFTGSGISSVLFGYELRKEILSVFV